jgi:dual specificity phosphatase 3
MTDLNFITSRLATAADLADDTRRALADLAHWQRLGITHVVDNRAEWTDEDFVAEYAPTIKYLDNGVDDAGQHMPDVWFDDGVSFIQDALTDPAAKVLVHCHMGINRGPSLAYAALLAEGWDPVDAIAQIRRVRPIAAVGYAEDALAWHQRRSLTPQPIRVAQRRQLRQWRQDNWIDVVRIIRDIRRAEAS